MSLIPPSRHSDALRAGGITHAPALLNHMPLPALIRRFLVRDDAPAPVAGRAVVPDLPTLDQMRHLPAKLRDFDPAYDAELHGKMKRLHEQLAREHR